LFEINFLLKLMYMETGSIKFWAEDDRPREKLLLKGKAALSDAELLAIIIGSGTRNKSAVELAREILSSCNYDLNQFCKSQLSDLTKFNGIGEAKAINILAALELGRRRKDVEITKKTTIKSASQVYQHLKPYLLDLQHEEFYAIFLNRKNEIIKTSMISSGGITSTLVDGRMIFGEAFACKATAYILSHNHPSGQCSASEEDIRLTKNLKKFGDYINLELIDHLIFTDNGYFSFAENGEL